MSPDKPALPQPIIDAILPQAVRGNEVMAQFGMIELQRAAAWQRLGGRWVSRAGSGWRALPRLRGQQSIPA